MCKGRRARHIRMLPRLNCGRCLLFIMAQLTSFVHEDEKWMSYIRGLCLQDVPVLVALGQERLVFVCLSAGWLPGPATSQPTSKART
jgi:hypothetical protein